jgi:glycosyltransferase involved in cell wall biosynthesis
MRQPLVSVIIPTWNSSRTLDLCLRSVISQTYKEIEILIVDGGSSDDTLKIARKYKINVIISNKRGRTIQRNVGVLNARGRFLLHVDSDEVLHPKLIEECIKEVFNKKIDAVFIPTIDTGQTYIEKSRCFGNVINLFLRKDIYIPNSALRFYNKKVFDLIKGYDEDVVIGEDVLFGLKCLKFGFRVSRCKYPIIHYGSVGLRNIFLKKYYYGKTFKRYRERARILNYNLSKKHIEDGGFYLMHLFKLKNYARYIPGFFIVKVIERLGLILGDIVGL